MFCFVAVSKRRRLGTERDNEKAWHKMAKKSKSSEKKSQTLLDEILLFAARIREYTVYRMYRLQISLPNI